MKRSGQIAMLRFPQTDLNEGKLRPALLLAALPGNYGDWLVCMLSTKLHQAIGGFDETIGKDAADFDSSGLRVPSVIRVGRLAVVSREVLAGFVGEVSAERLRRIRENLLLWIKGGSLPV